MSIQNIIFILFLYFIIVLCEEDKEKNSSLLTNNTSINEEPRKVIDSKKSFNMTIDEMDTMILCTLVVQESLRKQRAKINQIGKKLNLSNSSKVQKKIATDIFEKCNKKLNIKIVNKYIKNLTFFNSFNWERNFDEISNIDSWKYENEKDLQYTVEQQVLMYKFGKVEEIYNQKRLDDSDRFVKEIQRIRIGKLDLEKIPTSVKLSIFLVILVIFFGSIFYFLKSLQRKPNAKKKKKKNQ